MKSVLKLLIAITVVITSCTKSNDSGNGTLEASINEVEWKATNVNAVWYGEDLPGNQGNFLITGYTNDGKAIYLSTKDVSASNLSFREVILLNFTASTDRINNKIILQWKTANETNADNYAVERSTDAINFSLVGQVKAIGNKDTVFTYNYSEKPPFINPFEFDGFYYRLKIMDLNGNHAYSPIIKIFLRSPAVYKYADNASDYALGYSGSINVTEVNTTQRRISGTFSFSYTNGNTGQQEKIEKGIFKNVHY